MLLFLPRRNININQASHHVLKLGNDFVFSVTDGHRQGFRSIWMWELGIKLTGVLFSWPGHQFSLMEFSWPCVSSRPIHGEYVDIFGSLEYKEQIRKIIAGKVLVHLVCLSGWEGLFPRVVFLVFAIWPRSGYKNGNIGKNCHFLV